MYMGFMKKGINLMADFYFVLCGALHTSYERCVHFVCRAGLVLQFLSCQKSGGLRGRGVSGTYR